MAKKKPKPLYAIGRLFKTSRLVPGYPIGIASGAHIETIATVYSSSAGWRYHVSYRGNTYWLDEDAIEPLA